MCLGDLPTSYWTAADIVANQQVFFRYPSFDTGVFNATSLSKSSDKLWELSDVILAAEANKQTITLGEALTQNAEIATNYTNPVFAVTGDRD